MFPVCEYTCTSVFMCTLLYTKMCTGYTWVLRSEGNLQALLLRLHSLFLRKDTLIVLVLAKQVRLTPNHQRVSSSCPCLLKAGNACTTAFYLVHRVHDLQNSSSQACIDRSFLAMVVNIDCQIHRIQSPLGEKPLGTTMTDSLVEVRLWSSLQGTILVKLIN